jgi:F-type H+-transporting ATPase subunit a
MMAGHTIVDVFAGLGVLGSASGGILGTTLGVIAIFFVVVMNTVLTGLDLVVAVLQAYIFATLACVYLNDAVHLH